MNVLAPFSFAGSSLFELERAVEKGEGGRAEKGGEPEVAGEKRNEKQNDAQGKENGPDAAGEVKFGAD